MDKKEAIAALEGIKREKEQNVRYTGLKRKRLVSKWLMEIEALNLGIVEIQLTIDNQ